MKVYALRNPWSENVVRRGKDHHRSLVEDMLKAGLPWGTIVRGDLDDPFLNSELRDTVVREHLRRRKHAAID